MAERLSKMVDGILRRMTTEEEAAFIADRPVAMEPPPLTRLSKAELWRRLTDDEADALDAALAAAPTRLRRIFEAAQYLDTTDADYPALREGVIAALGLVRADIVLQPDS